MNQRSGVRLMTLRQDSRPRANSLGHCAFGGSSTLWAIEALWAQTESPTFREAPDNTGCS
jgi:hypothetical protein